MEIVAILKTIELAGSALPAFKALFDQVVDTFDEDDQVKLKQSYADAMAASDRQHERAQNL